MTDFDSFAGTAANAIRELRMLLGDNQPQFASRMGLAPGTVARYETGAQVPKTRILMLLSDLARREGFIELASRLRQEFTNRVQEKNRVREAKSKRGTAAVFLLARTWAERSRREAVQILTFVKAYEAVPAMEPDVAEALREIRSGLEMQIEIGRKVRELANPYAGATPLRIKFAFRSGLHHEAHQDTLEEKSPL